MVSWKPSPKPQGQDCRSRTQAADIARTLGLHERRFAHYVSGTREPDLNTLVKISKALGTTPNQLLGLYDEGSDTPEQAELVERLV